MTGCLALLAIAAAFLGLGVYSSSEAPPPPQLLVADEASPASAPSAFVTFRPPAWARSGKDALSPQDVTESYDRALAAIERRLGDRGSVYLSPGSEYPSLVVALVEGSGLTADDVERLVTLTGGVRAGLVANDEDLKQCRTSEDDERTKLDRWIEAGGSYAAIDLFNRLAATEGGPAAGLWWAMEPRDDAQPPQPMLLIDRAGDPIDGAWWERFYKTRNRLDEPVIGFAVSSERNDDFAAFTRNNLRRRLALVVGSEVITSPVLNGELNGGGVIEGRFTEADVDELLAIISNPIPLLPVERSSR